MTERRKQNAALDNQKPTYAANIPRSRAGDGEQAIRLASVYFGEALPWQEYVLRVLLARTKNDKYTSATAAISVPRQNGKSWLVRARCFYGALIAGEKILYTCQHADTSDEMFQALAAPFDDPDEKELASYLLAVRKANGQQAIKLTNGGLIRFTTRTDSLARGKTYDVIIYDEAQDLTATQQAASLPTIAAGSQKNPQTIYLGTPPKLDSVGDVFRSLRNSVRAGESKCAWLEWGVDEIGDINDNDRVKRVNPAYGELLNEEAIEGERDQMPRDIFAMERLGWWAKREQVTQRTLVSEDAWAKCLVEVAPEEHAKMAIGVKFSPDGANCAVSWAQTKPNYVELYELSSGRSTSWLVEMLVRNQNRFSSVYIDGRTGAASLIMALHEAGFPRRAIHEVAAKDMVNATGMFLTAIEEGTIGHIASPALDDSVTGSIERKIGVNAVGFGDGVQSTSIAAESAALAYYAAQTTKRNAARKQKASF